MHAGKSAGHRRPHPTPRRTPGGGGGIGRRQFQRLLCRPRRHRPHSLHPVRWCRSACPERIRNSCLRRNRWNPYTRPPASRIFEKSRYRQPSNSYLRKPAPPRSRLHLRRSRLLRRDRPFDTAWRSDLRRIRYLYLLHRSRHRSPSRHRARLHRLLRADRHRYRSSWERTPRSRGRPRRRDQRSFFEVSERAWPRQ